MKRKSLVILLLIGSLLLSGCLNNQSPEEKMFEALEKVVSAEKVFKEQQNPLVELEQQEKKLYDQIISLSMKEFEEITKLSDEALDIVDQRKNHMDKENESIEQSKAEFDKTKEIIEEIDAASLKGTANELYDIMMDRYDIHDELYGNYIAAIEYDRELYELFKQEDVTIEELENQISKINDSYEKVLKDNEQFNEKTEKYNEVKLSFYKDAGLEVKENKE
ncbi:YkyA family protein [Cytobacillus purgationiresistens]|uniref:Peptidoglycan hydrolase CwlO-like protein n=1 Tax=Cytobacillus purgationiresistens TaxID=863449 RepID=A0ABU0AMF5_9BACI|nr:YkyA family protein [Cytobacillus purgationiresistens]MDQ0272444.1 peptidoglycan hydrolase CwlO-like protein [Cytobacillus purgationiresistens]